MSDDEILGWLNWQYRNTMRWAADCTGDKKGEVETRAGMYKAAAARLAELTADAPKEGPR